MSWFDRVKVEKEELDAKIEKLRAFINSDPNTLSLRARSLLYEQHEAMVLYSIVLGKRIDLSMDIARKVS